MHKKRSIKQIFFLIFSLYFSLLNAQEVFDYSRVKIYLEGVELEVLNSIGIDIDHGHLVPNKFYINDLSKHTIQALSAKNIRFEVLIADVQTWYASRNQEEVPLEGVARNEMNCNISDFAASLTTPKNFTLGSMGGYLTYEELLLTLDLMKEKFPDLITEKQSIGNYLTQENRPIYWLKIGKDVEQNVDKPAILYTALHHAREPMSLSQMIYFMWYLLEHYESDALVNYLLTHTDLYFVPCINPDGYVFNNTLFPNGGGLWRKNRWINEFGNPAGVDLNRNYDFNWFDNEGSSGNQGSDLYRGTSPFSEPETQAIRDLCLEKEFKIALNYHSFSNVLIRPFGQADKILPFEDAQTYNALGQLLTRENQYPFGSALETIGIVASGTSDDWMYGEMNTKNKIYSMTPEVGSLKDGFYPPINRIEPLCQDNLWQNLAAAYVLKSVGHLTPLDDKEFNQTEDKFSFKFSNWGLEKGTFNLRFTALSDNLKFENPISNLELAHLDSVLISLDYTFTPSENLVEELLFEVAIDNGLYIQKQQFNKRFIAKPYQTLFTDSGENIDDWEVTGRWNITDEGCFSDFNCYADSPAGNYSTDTSSTMTLKKPIDFTNAQSAMLKFKAKWEFGRFEDFLEVQIGPNTRRLSNLCGKFTTLNNNQKQVYQGVQEEWVQEEIDITNFVGQPIFVRFQISADDFEQLDGFSFDDFSIEAIIDESVALEEINNPLENLDIIIRPNPFREYFNIELNLPNDFPPTKIRYLNLLGQEVLPLQKHLSATGTNQFDINTSTWSKGIYFIEITTVNGQKIGKEIVKI